MPSTSSFDRRSFLRHALGLGAVGSVALLSGVALEGCGTSPTPSTTTSTTTTTKPVAIGPPTAKDWATLAASLTGTLVLPTSGSYNVDRLLYNAKFENPHPLALAYCASADDVARCVDFATSHEIRVAARSGGHSYGGYSNCDGLVIDVSRLSSIDVDTRANVATVGAGAQLIDIYNVLGGQGRLLPGGSCPTVGIAGLALGGGIGVFGRKYGLTSDNLRAVSLVTADSQLVQADAANHSDLWWASRGGGGGNFGVATSFTFDVHPMPEVTLFTLQFPWAAAATLLEAWQAWMSAAPDELWSNCQLLSQGTSGFLIQVGGVYCGSSNDLSVLIAQLQSSVATTPTYSFVGSRDYLSAMEIEAGCSGLTIAACHLSTDVPGGTLSREAYSAKSSYVNAPMDHAGATAMIAAIENLAVHAPTLGGALAFDSYGGAINRVPATETAFVHRDKLAGIQATYSWSTYTPASVIAAGATWLTWLGTNVFTPATGAYQNYIDPTLDNWQEAYYGSNLARLTTVKRTYDPDDHFSFAQSIPRSFSGE
ncbi:MAG TPA: FAD-binding oxidoreductase [Acidimicrobiales bacterium]|nr:FAD-binding oxidoreductase [Acidimicrobiales bacterium]